MDLISIIYILDILVLILALGYRGRQNGMLPESFFFVSTLLSGLAAQGNYQGLTESLKGMLSGVDISIIVAISYALIFIIARALLAILGLQVFTQLRITPFIKPINEYVGIGFGALKALILASVVIQFIGTLTPVLPLSLTDPIQHNSMVKLVNDLIQIIYQP